MKRIVAAFTITSLVTSAGLAGAQPPARGRVASSRADELLRVGLVRYDAGDFAGAVAAFEEGYSIEPRPTFLFAAAQAERRSGDCPRAIALYDRFLASSPSASQAAAARDQRAKCVEMLPAPEPEIQPAPEPRAAPPRGAGLVASSDAKAWYTDPLTDGLVAGAGVMLAVGAGFSLAASGAVDDANGADTYAGYDDAASRASRDRTIGLVALAGGVGLGAVAAWRIVHHRGRPTRERAALLVGPGTLLVRGSF